MTVVNANIAKVSFKLEKFIINLKRIKCCVNIDMKKFGGTGVSKQCCLSKQCLAVCIEKDFKIVKMKIFN